MIYRYRWYPFKEQLCRVLVWGRGPVISCRCPDWLVVVDELRKPIRNNRLVKFKDGTRAIVSGNGIEKAL